MQLTQVMGLPFWALQEPALMSVLPGAVILHLDGPLGFQEVFSCVDG